MLLPMKMRDVRSTMGMGPVVRGSARTYLGRGGGKIEDGKSLDRLSGDVMHILRRY
jgi:hypothetical protein